MKDDILKMPTMFKRTAMTHGNVSNFSICVYFKCDRKCSVCAIDSVGNFKKWQKQQKEKGGV